MPYSVLEENQKEPKHLYQPFTHTQWEAYPFAAEEDLRWFREAKLGLFLHIGLSCLGPVELGWGRRTHKIPDSGFGPVPDEIYDGWANKLSFSEFDAERWAALAKRGGMRYVVIVAKHHDGFHMWDTKYSEHKITNSPFGRDYIREMVEAFRKEGIKVGLYYSQRDWFHPDYEPIAEGTCETIQEPPYYRLLPGETLRCGEKHKNYIKYMHNTVRELMENYGKIDVLWWDACWWGNMFTEEMWDADKLEREVRRLQPHILINNRASLPGDFDTPEGQVGFFQNNRPWETCMPLGTEWVWNGEPVKSFKMVLSQFINCVCGDGNYLLSIGAMPDGRYGKEEAKRIEELGSWLRRYGESVYGTRGGPWRPAHWGGSVYRGNTIYLHLLEEKDVLHLPSLDNEIVSYQCLTGEDVVVRQTDSEVTIEVKGRNEETCDVIVELSMQEPVSALAGAEAGHVFDLSSAVYGKPIARYEGSAAGLVWYRAKLPEDFLLTGILVEGAGGKEMTAETDGEAIWNGICKEETEITVERLQAGAWICGRKAGTVSFLSNEAVDNLSIVIYGRPVEE